MTCHHRWVMIIQIYVHVYIYICIRVFVYIYLYAFVCLYIHDYIYIYIHIYVSSQDIANCAYGLALLAFDSQTPEDAAFRGAHEVL
jgi:hypothetical protein